MAVMYSTALSGNIKPPGFYNIEIFDFVFQNLVSQAYNRIWVLASHFLSDYIYSQQRLESGYHLSLSAWGRFESLAAPRVPCEDWSDCRNAQADLCLLWEHMLSCKKCCVPSHLHWILEQTGLRRQCRPSSYTTDKGLHCLPLVCAIKMALKV